ncbi:DUF2239 family protein [Novosphingobium sp. ZN18A2]|uniref:DUF2239 family protein n=1 Tax=Novosphingobium sp. ZN18A2 TaxID=3079861 RepID=UPI0030CD3D0F
MTDTLSRPCTAFAGTRRIASGSLADVALAIKAEGEADGPVLTFDDATGAVIDLDLRGTTADIVTRLAEHAELVALAASTARRPSPASSPSPPPTSSSAPRGRGRPKLGVVAREVTLLPRHWEWLSAQPGGASQALRRLVEHARRADGWHTRARAAREAAYRFLSALAGDLPGYEEAIRALFAGDDDAFAHRMADWPEDIRAHALKLAGATTPKDTA